MAKSANPVAGVDVDYREVFDAVPGLYLLLDKHFTIVTANRAYCRATMTDAAQIAGRFLFDIFPDNPGDPAATGVQNLRRSLERVLTMKQPDIMPVQKYDIRNERGSFETRYWSPVNIPVLGASGEVGWIIHRVEDVTALMRLQSESARRDQIATDQAQLIDELRYALEENARLQTGRLYLASIVESSHDPIIATDLDGKVTSWNRAAEELFGYSDAEMTGQSISKLFPATIVEAEKDLLQHVRRGEKIARYRTQRTKKDGTVLDVQLTISPILDGAGAIVGASKIVEDISEKLSAEHKMRRLAADRSYLADIVESSNDAIIARTLDGRIASWNSAAAKMFGYNASEVMGLSTDILAPTERKGEAQSILERLESGEEAIHYETMRITKNGTPLFVSVTASPIFDEQRRIKGMSAAMRDITDQRHAEERLKTLQAELIHLSRWNTMGMMASTIAHELNQPLTATVNYVRAARRMLNDSTINTRVIELLDNAADETKLAGGIIRSLREFVDKRESVRRPENLNKLIEEAISLSRGGAPGAPVEINVVLEPLLPPVLVDKIQIEQVLLNLIRNAQDAMAGREHQNITVTTLPDNEWVLVCVHDSGPGISPEVAERLFQPFVTTKEKGMGIGLTICHSIIEAHGGRIWAETGRDGGAVFLFRLPSAETAK